MRALALFVIIIQCLGLCRGVYEIYIGVYKNAISIIVLPILIYFSIKTYIELEPSRKCQHDWKDKGFGTFEDDEVKVLTKRCSKCKKIEQDIRVK